MARNIAVGIDLGTTNSVVAYLTPEGESKVLLNAENEPLTPSVVVFNDQEVLVGKVARDLGGSVLDRTAECAKRDMGHQYYHRAIGDRLLPPETIQGFILRKLSRDIQSRLTDDCDVVITVPAYFDESRRQATMDAGLMSGLHVIDIVNEPTAAALSFGQSLGYLRPTGGVKSQMRVLVYDLGGGTFDVTLIQLNDKKFVTLATDGDIQLGGYDWDMRLVDYVQEHVKSKYPNLPPFDELTQFNLRRQMESVKHQLSTANGVDVQWTYRDKNIELRITRELFEELTADLLERTAFTTRETLRAANLTWSDVDRVLLVGGSTRMPMVRRMLAELSGIQPDNAVHPDEAVARGAAIFSFIRQRGSAGTTPSGGLSITDVSSHSLGIEGIDEQTLRKENITLIPKNSPLPATVAREFVTKEENQENVLVRLLEGESRHPDHCNELARARINNLPSGLPKGTKVKVVYTFDHSGRLSVEAAIPGVGREAKMELQRERSLPDLRLQQWKKVICEDGGYSRFDGMTGLIDSALCDPDLSSEEVIPAVFDFNRDVKPAVDQGAPLAASNALKENIRLSTTKNSVSIPRPSRTPHSLTGNLVGHIVFSIIGVCAGLYVVSILNPSFVKYLPDWLAQLFR
jgi:molecular chaperone DnaK